MERWSSLSGRQKVAVTMGVSAGAALLYVFYSRYRTAPHLDEELRATIPQQSVGRDGAIAKQLATRSLGHINVNATPDGGEDRKLTKGIPAQVRQNLRNGAVLKEDLHYPARSIGRIIGQGGERIREITKISGARINCEPRTENSEATATRRITVSGTREQVEAAKTLLQKVSEEEAAVQRRAAESSNFRSRRKEIITVKKKDRQRPQEDQEPPLPLREALQTEDSADDRPPEDEQLVQENMADGAYICKFEVPSPDFNFRADEYVDVYVSATESPEHFWIQILGSRSIQLDKLITEMSDHYQRKKRGSVPQMQVGDIVAAPFHSDKFWYRAEVLGFLKNGNVDLYYVDYGDNSETARENLYPLRSDFLSLPFQAIECRLSGVAPHGGAWSDQALDDFDALSHCAEWKPLLAKISSFPSPGVSRCFQIQLYEPSTDPMLDIGLELVRRGFAIECTVSPVKADDDDASLVSRLLEEVINLSVGSEPYSSSSRQEEGRLASDGSVERMRADVNPSPEPQQSAISTPSSCVESVEETDGLEQSICKLHISGSGQPSPGASSPADDTSTSPSPLIRSSASEYSTSSASEEQSFVSSLEDSSVYSPRGCFYYMTDEASNSSLCSGSSSGDVITVSSDSEEDTRRVQAGVKKRAMDSDVFLSPSSDVIVIEDDP